MKNFILYWLTGKTTTVTGNTIQEAMTNAGYGNGALRALDFYDEATEQTYIWDKEARTWFIPEETEPELEYPQ